MPLDAARRPRRRLVVPACRTDAREVLVPALPFFLRGTDAPEAKRPPLLGFEGAGFMDDFLAAVADPAKLPKLLPWRDWAEPPAGVLDAAGNARYPAELVRERPIALDGDGLPGDGIPAGAPPWLRKLYLPLHARFTLVAFDLVCRRLGFPPVDRARVIGAGAVVRRLRPDRSALRWEDWISADGKRGVWIELKQPIEQLDPEAIAPAAFQGQELALRARLGLAADAPLPAALDSAKLALLAGDSADGAAARHCTLYGYVPVQSPAEQAPEAVPASPADTVAALKARATDAMQAAANAVPQLAPRIRNALSDLLAETVLPPRPDAASVTAAWATVQVFTGTFQPAPPGGGAAAAALTLDRGLRTVLSFAFGVLQPAQVDANAVSPDAPESTADWLGRARFGVGALAAGPGDKTVAFGSAWGAENLNVNWAAWHTLQAERLHQMAGAILDGSALPQAWPGQPAALDADDLGLLLGCALLRLRVLRLALAAELRRQMFGAAAELASLTAMLDGLPAQTPGVLGQEIAAALGLEAWRGTPQEPSWPVLDAATPKGSGDLRAHR
ncbi:hypothetical protein, partial [Falsiroseomonas oryzae]|uniref:hypothetical protein n=1 Tax=Falsiroseomonas oryzae TaxID=2766473 RepID=UPI0022EB4574